TRDLSPAHSSRLRPNAGCQSIAPLRPPRSTTTTGWRQGADDVGNSARTAGPISLSPWRRGGTNDTTLSSTAEASVGIAEQVGRNVTRPDPVTLLPSVVYWPAGCNPHPRNPPAGLTGAQTQ